MFRRKKEEVEAAKPAEPTPVRAATTQPSMLSPQPAPERPAGSSAQTAPAAPIRPEGPRPIPAPGSAAPKPAAPQPAAAPAPAKEEEAKRLIVGKGIVLNGEITSCDRLVVEGRVEATLSKTKAIEISPTGVFKGAAEIEEATVAGLYDGKLTCKGKLTIRGSGRVQGEVRYGEIEIEAGGVISGNVGATAG